MLIYFQLERARLEKRKLCVQCVYNGDENNMLNDRNALTLFL